MDFSALNSFHNDLKEWDIVLTDKQNEQFLNFYELLVEWNSFMNLTAITDFDEVMKKHFLDSLAFVRYLKDKEDAEPFYENYVFRMIDVGTGAGFPGIPLAILFPNASFVLMDSLNKRIKFLEEVKNKLQLTNVSCIHSRAEDLARNPDYREQFDYAVSRAVANLSTLTEYCIPFVKPGGAFVSYKSERLQEELDSARKAFLLLNVTPAERIEFTLPNSDIHRSLLSVEKVCVTPKKYPRKAGLPSKEPL